MNHPTDRQRVERMLLPFLMRGVVENGAVDPSDIVAQGCRQLLSLAESEAIVGVSVADRHKLARRMLRAARDAIGPYQKEGASVAKVGLMLYYVLKALVDTEYLTLHGGSAMDQALEKLLPALEPSASIKKLDASAQKAARRVLVKFQSMGYFAGVPVEAIALPEEADV